MAIDTQARQLAFAHAEFRQWAAAAGIAVLPCVDTASAGPLDGLKVPAPTNRVSYGPSNS